MKTLFQCKNYQEYLGVMIDEQKSLGLTKTGLAKIMGCQAAYLSQVLKEKVHLTEEHLQRLGVYLQFSDIEMEYLLLLLRISKAGSQDLKHFLEKTRNKMLKLADELEPRIAVQDENRTKEALAYYTSTWIPSVIHIATSCEGTQTSKAIAERFGFDLDFVQLHLQNLAKYKFVEFEKGQWNYNGGSIHFPKNSDFDKQIQITRRLLTLNKISFRKEKDLHYSAIFAVDLKTAVHLRTLFLDLIEIVHKEVEPSPSKDVYAINLDFYKI